MKVRILANISFVFWAMEFQEILFWDLLTFNKGYLLLQEVAYCTGITKSPVKGIQLEPT